MASVAFSEPDLAITEEEAHNITEAVQNVAQYYDVSADPKMMAWIDLMMCVGGVYGTRFIAIHRKRKSKRVNSATPFMVPKPPPPIVQPPATPSPKPEAKPQPIKQAVNAGLTNPSDIFGTLEPEFGGSES